MKSEEEFYWIWLNEIKGIGNITARRLLNIFSTPENIFNASYDELISAEYVGDKTARAILDARNEVMDKAEKILNKCRSNNIKILPLDSEFYPEEVRTLHGSPILLYFSGTLEKNVMGTGIVGSRRCTEYGKRITTEAAEFLSERGIAVISGMAKGIDGYAHTACINSGGYTIAFLGCGIDIAYPEEHRKLMKKIKETGAVISEYPPGTKPNGKNFPERNRLIAAFSKELLVVEANKNSGALITAAFAKKYKRTVFAAPNSIFLKESEGTNKLILNGSEIYLSPKQLFKEFPEIKSESALQQNINSEVLGKLISDSVEKMILESLNKEPKTIDELKKILNNEGIDIIEKLSLMELDGKIIIRAGRVSAI